MILKKNLWDGSNFDGFFFLATAWAPKYLEMIHYSGLRLIRKKYFPG